jgi:hypothetical protein
MAEIPKNPSGGAPINPANLDDAVNAPTSKFAQATNEPKAPAGTVLPPKKETGKVQPKKETVRINLPPKPTAAPTIKLPTLPPGGPTGAPTPVRAPGKPDDLVNAPTTKLAGATTEAKAPAVPRGATAAPAAGQRPGTAPAPRPAAAQAAATVSGLDKILAISAMVFALFALGTVVYLWKGISIDY